MTQMARSYITNTTRTSGFCSSCSYEPCQPRNEIFQDAYSYYSPGKTGHLHHYFNFCLLSIFLSIFQILHNTFLILHHYLDLSCHSQTDLT